MQDLSYAEAGGVMVILDDGSALPWPAGTQSTCFPSTKVQILTPKYGSESKCYSKCRCQPGLQPRT
jgi:hypothetical protein